MQSPSDPAQAKQDEARPANGLGPRWLRFTAIAVIFLVALVGLYAALGFLVAPRVIRDQVVAQAAQRYHRKARIGEVRLNPFTLRLEAEGFRLPDADGGPMIGFDRLTVQVSPRSLWRGLDFEEIAVEGPRVRVVIRPGGRINLQDLAPPPSAKPAKPGPPPKILIEHLVVRRGAGEFVDRDRRTPFAKAFAPIGFSLRDFSTVKDGARFSLKAVTDRGERLAWRGTFGVAPLASQGEISLAGVQAVPLAALAGEAVPFALSSGTLDVASSYRFGLDRDHLDLTLDIGQAKLSGVGLRAHGADRDWVSLAQLTVSDAHVDVPGRAVRVGRVDLNNPSVTAWLDRDGINLARYAGPKAPAPAKAPGPAAPAWSASLPDLHLHGGSASFEDRTAASPVRIAATPIELAVTGFAWPIKAPVQVEASAGVDGGGRLAAKGQLTLDQPAADLDIEAAKLSLARLQPYLDKAVSLKLLSGALSAKGHLAYAQGAAKFAGQAEVDDLHTVDNALHQDFINWRSLKFAGLTAQSRPLAIKIAEVDAEQPYAKVVIGPTYVMNIKTVLSPEGAAPAPPQAQADTPTPATPSSQPPKQGLPIEIGLVKVNDGRMDFSDLSIQPHFAAGVESLGGTIQGLSGRQDARATVDLTGQVDRYSPVVIGGQVNYFAARTYTDVRMSFQNMELTTFSPYSGKFAGYRIDKGKLNVDLHYNIDDQKLHATHHVMIDQLQLGDKVDSTEAVKLPVKLIVALLKDKNGLIDLPIEIDGTLGDPKFQIWPLIWHVVHNLMVKVATAPFTALGKLVGGGEELSYVDFAPGAAALDDPGRQKLASLAKALAERPAVALEIPMITDPEADRPVLAQARFDAEIAAAQAETPPVRGKPPSLAEARVATLERAYQKAFGAKPEPPKPAKGAPKAEADQAAAAWLEAQLRARIAISDEELQQLGRARAAAVQAALADDGHIDPSRLFVVTAPPQDAPIPRMTLALR